jgi:hypothetical protein
LNTGTNPPGRWRPREVSRLHLRATAPKEEIFGGETGLLDAATKAECDQQYRAVQVLYFAMLASLVGYVVIGLVLGSTRAPSTPAAPAENWVRSLYLLSIGLIVAAYLVKKRMVRPLVPELTPGEIKQRLASFRSGHLITYVLCESIGLLGLLALFLGGSRSQFINLVVVAFALMILLRPKRIDSSSS